MLFPKILLIFFVFTFNISAYVIGPNEVFTDTFESITFDSLVISGTLMFANNGSLGGDKLRQIIITNGDFILASGGLVTQSFDILNLSSNGIDGAPGGYRNNGEDGGDGFGFGFGGIGGKGADGPHDIYGFEGCEGGNGGAGGFLGGNGGNGGIGPDGLYGEDGSRGCEGGNGGSGGKGAGGANGFTVMVVNTTIIAGNIKINGNISLHGVKGGNGANGGTGGGGGGYVPSEGFSGGNGGDGKNGGNGGVGSDILLMSTNGNVFLNNYHNFVNGGSGGFGGAGGNAGDGGTGDSFGGGSGDGGDGGNGGNGGSGGSGGTISISANVVVQDGVTSIFSQVENLSNGGAGSSAGIGGTNGSRGYGSGGEDGIPGVAGISGQSGYDGYVYFNILSDTNPPVCIGNPIILPQKHSALLVGESVLLSYSPTNFFDNRTLTNSLRHTIEIVSSNNVFGESFLQVGESDLLNRAPFNNLYFVPLMDMANQHFLFRFITKDLADNISTNIFYDNVLSVIIVSVNTNYVSLNGKHVPPFDSWALAATNIQDAVNAAFADNIVLVSNGTYSGFGLAQYGSNVVAISKEITISSVNGAAHTVVDGQKIYRAFYITNGVVLNGFTITNSYVSGGMPYGFGGGVFMDHGGIIENCIITCNSAWNGGGIACYYNGIVQNCIISRNSANGEDGGAGVMLFYGGTTRNCLITDNRAIGCWGGGGINCKLGGTIENSTICSNSATYDGGGVYSSNFEQYKPCIRDCIIYFNIAGRNDNNWHDYDLEGGGNTIFEYNCTTPDPGGTGNITSDPQFVSDNNFRLQSTSPCIDAGTNMSWMLTATDLDGNPRIIDGIVDMGAYEYVPEPCYLLFIIYQFIFINYLRRKKYEKDIF